MIITMIKEMMRITIIILIMIIGKITKKEAIIAIIIALETNKDQTYKT